MSDFDIVIPVGPNDINMIKEQIIYTKKNIIGYRNIYLIVCTENIIINDCIIINEKIFPFQMKDIQHYLGINKINGWFLQQLLKLYAGKIIPNILNNYLVIDADTFFMKPTVFIKNNIPLYNIDKQNHKPYFDHMKKLHPSFIKHIQDSGITHHMFFQQKYLNEIFTLVEKLHEEDFWKVFLKCVTEKEGSGASEYELYFNYIFKNHSDKVKIRKLRFIHSKNLSSKFYYVSRHWYLYK